MSATGVRPTTSIVAPRGGLWVYACRCGYRLQHRLRRFVALLGPEHDCTPPHGRGSDS